MAFAFKLRFTGICTFVPIEENGKIVAMAALLVDARRAEDPALERKRSLDKREMDRHVGFLRYRLKHTGGHSGDSRELEGLWHPENHLLWFNVKGGDLFSLDEGDVANFPLLESIAPRYCKIDPTALETDAVSNSAPVLLHVPIEKGKVYVDSFSRSEWDFGNSLWTDHDIGGREAKKWVPKKLAHRLVVDFGTVDSVSVRTRSLIQLEDQETDGAELISFATDESVVLDVFNLCDDNPLQWLYKKIKPKKDKDFKWHYELLEDKGGIKEQLKGFLHAKHLPHPIPLSTSASTESRILSSAAFAEAASQGDNCYGSRTAPVAREQYEDLSGVSISASPGEPIE